MIQRFDNRAVIEFEQVLRGCLIICSATLDPLESLNCSIEHCTLFCKRDYTRCADPSAVFLIKSFTLTLIDGQCRSGCTHAQKIYMKSRIIKLFI